ncbi:MAG: glycosyltransferase family 2 protein [Desulfovibrio sp.]|jgi:GT2 family glycosyltransferase|nr:glycosyltransferase family 2 protein [Desulfovibrio sp.]
MNPLFSVIIPVLNNWDLTHACLQSLREHTPDTAFEVIVVDNASSDATETELQALGTALFGENFLALRFAENRNFGPASNAGALRAKSPLLFFLNNDTLLTPGWAPPLLAALESDPGLGAVGPLLLYEDNTVQHIGVAFTLTSVSHLYRTFPTHHPAVRRKRHLQALTAAALLMPRALFLEAGSFYEGYRNGFEDVDLCLRLSADFGKRLCCVLESAIYHLESRTPGRKTADSQNLRLLSKRRNGRFSPDLHILGLEDGFEPFISDGYGIGLRLRKEEEEELTAAARGKEPSFWYAQLRDNPYWAAGHRELISMLEKAGEGREAVPLFLELCILERKAETFREGAIFAARHRDGKTSSYMAERYEELLRSRKNRALAYSMLRMVKGRDTFLQNLYEEKIRENFSGAVQP